MQKIGVGKLHRELADVLRQIREKHETYVITEEGDPIAILRPVDQVTHLGTDAGWETYTRLAEKIRGAWPDGLDTQSLMDAIRR